MSAHANIGIRPTVRLRQIARINRGCRGSATRARQDAEKEWSVPGGEHGLFDNLVVECIAHEFCIVFHLHFFENAASIGTDGFHAER